jgi:hypothetical protein
MTLATEVEVRAKEFSELSNEQLLIELGKQLEEIEQQFSKSTELSAARPPAVKPDASELAAIPGADRLKRIGQRFFNRFGREFYSLMCNPDDPDYPKVKEAIETGGERLGLVLAGILAASFGWLPAIITIIVALLIKRLANCAHQEFCDAWKEDLAG